MFHSCKICGFTTREINHPKFGSYHYCERCEFISKDEEYIVSHKEELSIYNNHNNSIEDPRYVEFFYKFLEDAVFKYVGEGKNGFDFGSGPSPVLAQILEKYHDYNMDIYDLFYAKEKTYIGKQYDLITSTEVVEHLINPMPYFKLFFELMKNDGILAIMTLFHKNDDEYFKAWHYIRDNTHISFYTPKTFHYIAKKVGLRIIHTDHNRYITFVKDSNDTCEFCG